MAKVEYKQGLKATYLGLSERLDTTLYWCIDTRELFKGNDLYSDGLRIVDAVSDLPVFSKAADGILYFCTANQCGYVLSRERDRWITVIRGIDGETIGVNTEGALVIKSVPLEAVSGLTQRLDDLEQDVVGGVRYCGRLASVELLPADARQGDLYEIEDGSEWCYNGEEWFSYGTTNPEKTKFDSLLQAQEWVDTHDCEGNIISVCNGGTWDAYVVGAGGELTQLGAGGSAQSFNVIDGGFAHGLV